MPYVIVLSQPPIQVYVKDSMFPIFDENAPETHAEIIRNHITDNAVLIGESNSGGVIAVARDKVAFIQYVGQEALDEMIEERKKEAEKNRTQISVPRFMVPPGKRPQ